MANQYRGTVPYRTLGRSGLEVSEIGLGCWAIGGASWRNGSPVGWSGNNDEESIAGLRRGVALGINHFDTADVYGDGHSERLLAQLLQMVERERLVIASKVGWFKSTAPHPYHPLHIRQQLEMTLSNLGTDYVDIYYLHNAYFGQDDAYLAAAAETVHRLRDEGKVRFIGQSAYSYAEFVRVCPTTQPDIIQFNYHALGTPFDAPDADIVGWAEEQNLGMVMFGPLAQGVLLDKFDPDNPPRFGEGDIRAGQPVFGRARLHDIHARLARIKARFGDEPEDLVRVAEQYCLAQSANAVIIPGFKNPKQVEMNLSAAGKPLSAEDVAFIRETLQG